MPTFTKNVIKSLFMKLLGSMPFDSITVKNIVGGINRIASEIFGDVSEFRSKNTHAQILCMSIFLTVVF